MAVNKRRVGRPDRLSQSFDVVVPSDLSNSFMVENHFQSFVSDRSLKKKNYLRWTNIRKKQKKYSNQIQFVNHYKTLFLAYL